MKITAPQFYPTRHAAKSMVARNITWAEILDAITAPDVVYESNTGKHAGKNSSTYQKDKLYVIVANEPSYLYYDSDHEWPLRAVITCGLRAQHQWTDAEAIARNNDTKEES